MGKWHLGGGRDMGDAPWPTAYGFDKSFTTFEGLGPRVLVSDEERFLAQQSDKLGEGPRFWEIKTNLTGLYADMTVDFVAQNSQKPWFVKDRKSNTSELQSLMRISYAVFCLKKKKKT